MDILLKTENEFEYFLIAPESDWWSTLLEAGHTSNFDFVPPLVERMPMESIFNRFKNENAFTIVASLHNSFAGCFCCYLKHPVTRRPSVQFILIAENFRNKKLTSVFFDLAFQTFRNYGCFLIEVRTWSTNYISQKVFTRCGFYLKSTLRNDRGRGIHTLVYERSVMQSENFDDLASLSIVCGEDHPMLSVYADEIRSLTLQSGGAKGSLPIDLSGGGITLKQILIPGEISIQTKSNGLCYILDPVFSESSEYLFHGKLIRFDAYINNAAKQKQGKHILFCNSSQISRSLITPDNIVLPDKKSQDSIDIMLNKILHGGSPGEFIAELTSIVTGSSVSGIIIGCIELYQIVDDLENQLADFDVINIFQLLKYDIADSWKA